MTLAIIDINNSDTLFEFDVAESEIKKLKIKWTDHPIEDGQNISDYGWVLPQEFTITGAVTAWPYFLKDLGGDSGVDFQRPQQILESLETLAKTGQPVVLICRYWTKEVVITNVSASTKVSLLKISISFKTFTVPKIKYTDIPETRLKGMDGSGGAAGSTDDDRTNKDPPKKPGGKQTGKRASKKFKDNFVVKKGVDGFKKGTKVLNPKKP